MIRNLLLVTLLINSTICCGQQRHSFSTKTKVKLFAAGGRSIFSTNVHKSLTKYPTSEHRIGLSFHRSMNKAFEFEVRPTIGIKMKGKVQNVLTPFDYLEESTKISYGFTEIPFLLNYHVVKRVIIKSGINTRFFLPSNNIQYGFLGSKFDFAVPIGVSVMLSKRISVGSEYIFGITKVLSLNYYDSNLEPQNGQLLIRNQVGQITIEYSITRKIK